MTKQEQRIDDRLEYIFEGAPDFYETLESNHHRIPVSQFGFKNGLYENVWEVAVHVAISSYTTWLDDEQLTTLTITDDLLIDALKLKGRRRRVKDNIVEAMNGLINKGIIEKVQENGDAYHIKQALVDGKKEWFGFTYSAYKSIVSHEVSDSEKIHLIATYASVATSTNRITRARWDKAIEGTSGQDAYTRMNTLRDGTCYKAQSTLMKSVGIKAEKTYKKYMDTLFELQLIFIMQVQHPHEEYNSDAEYRRVFNYYTKFEDREILHQMLHWMNRSSTQKTLEVLEDVFEYSPTNKTKEVNQQMLEVAKEEFAQDALSGGYAPNSLKDEINEEYGAELEHYNDEYNPKTIREELNDLETATDDNQQESSTERSGNCISNLFETRNDEAVDEYSYEDVDYISEEDDNPWLGVI